MAKDQFAEDEYELIPHQEIVELKDEIKRLHDNPPSPSKHLQISMNDLAKRLEHMTDVFEKAMRTMAEDEGGLTFKERMQPVLHRMDKILEQNAQIADGIVAMADMINELKEGSTQERPSNDLLPPPGMPPPKGRMPPGNMPPPPGFPPAPSPPLSGMPPPPPRKR